MQTCENANCDEKVFETEPRATWNGKPVFSVVAQTQRPHLFFGFFCAGCPPTVEKPMDNISFSIAITPSWIHDSRPPSMTGGASNSVPYLSVMSLLSRGSLEPK